MTQILVIYHVSFLQIPTSAPPNVHRRAPTIHITGSRTCETKWIPCLCEMVVQLILKKAKTCTPSKDRALNGQWLALMFTHLLIQFFFYVHQYVVY